MGRNWNVLEMGFREETLENRSNEKEKKKSKGNEEKMNCFEREGGWLWEKRKKEKGKIKTMTNRLKLIMLKDKKDRYVIYVRTTVKER